MAFKPISDTCVFVSVWMSGGAGGQSRLAESHMLRNRFSSSCLEPAAVHPLAAPLNILYLLLTHTMCTVCPVWEEYMIYLYSQLLKWVLMKA